VDKESPTREDEVQLGALARGRSRLALATAGAIVLGALAGATPAAARHHPSPANCNRAVLREYRRGGRRGFTRDQLNQLYRRLHRKGICPSVQIP